MVTLSKTFRFLLVESFGLTMNFTINTSQIFHPEGKFTCFPLKHGFQAMMSEGSLKNPLAIGQLSCLVIGHQNEANVTNP